MTNSQDSVAYAALKLMVLKGGTLRMRIDELQSVENFVLVPEQNPHNPEVMHFYVITKEAAEERAAAMQKVLDAIVASEKPPEPPKEDDAKQPD